MKARTYFIIGITAFFMFLIFRFGIAQQGAGEIQAQLAPEAEMQWLWGEVVSIDAAGKAFLVKYLDYETDTEKEMTVTVDEQTVYENIASLAELKPQDNVSIDYVLSPVGRNLARNISLEKPEVPSEAAGNVTEVEAANNTIPSAPAQ